MGEADWHLCLLVVLVCELSFSHSHLDSRILLRELRFFKIDPTVISTIVCMYQKCKECLTLCHNLAVALDYCDTKYSTKL